MKITIDSTQLRIAERLFRQVKGTTRRAWLAHARKEAEPKGPVLTHLRETYREASETTDTSTARRDTPFSRSLSGSYRARVLGNAEGGAVSLEITSRHPGVRVHEYGATIRAKSHGYLHFQLPDGEWVKVRKVKIKARPAILPTLEWATDRFQQFMLDDLVEATERASA